VPTNSGDLNPRVTANETIVPLSFAAMREIGSDWRSSIVSTIYTFRQALPNSQSALTTAVHSLASRMTLAILVSPATVLVAYRRIPLAPELYSSPCTLQLLALSG
jgi:hypothetical protein